MILLLTQLLGVIALAAMCVALMTAVLMGILSLVAGSPREEVPMEPNPGPPDPGLPEDDRAFDVEPVEPWKYAYHKIPSDDMKIERIGAYRYAQLDVFEGFYAVVFTEEHGAYLSRAGCITLEHGPPASIDIMLEFEVLADTVVRRCIIFNERDEYMSEVEQLQRRHQPMLEGDLLHTTHRMPL